MLPLIAFTAATTPATMTTPIPVPPFWTGYRVFAQQACFEPVPGGLSWPNGLLVQVP